jgi:hypothetical protein
MSSGCSKTRLEHCSEGHVLCGCSLIWTTTGLRRLCNSPKTWYREGDLNPHNHFWSADFKFFTPVCK